MRLISIRQAKPGMIVGRELVDDKGQILLHKDVSLTPEYIRALEIKGHTRLYVRDPNEPVVDTEQDISPAVRSRALLALRNTFEKIGAEVTARRAESGQDLSKAFESDHIAALLSKSGPLGQILEAVSAILGDVLSRSVLAGLTSIKTAGSQHYDHALDVCAVAIMIGRTAGLSHDYLRQLAAGCLLHDIGKIFLEPTVKGEAAVRQHTRLGYELLRASEERDILTPHVAYEHHERPDGKGLPRGIIACNRIKRDRSQAPPIPTLLGEICAVANAYDGLLSGREDLPALAPDMALRAIREGAGTQFNEELVVGFLRVVPVYPVGTEVLIRSAKFRNCVAVVSQTNPMHLDRPVVILTRDASGNRLEGPEIDLNEDTDILIQSKA